MAEGQFKEGIAGGRLSPAEYAENFSDLHPPLDQHEALVEADRCYFCYDAPCMKACPTSIDIPLFIRADLDRQSARLGQDHLRPEHPGRHVRPRLPDRDAVRGGLRARGGRRQAGADRPAAALRHRHRDGARTSSSTSAPRRPARRSPWSAPARPASPAAHRLALHGHDVTIFEARPKAGGLNEYGIAAYKTRRRFRPGRGRLRHRRSAASTIENGKALGRDFSLADLTANYDAVFLGMGLAGVNALARRGRGRRRRRRTPSTSSPSCARPRILATLPVGRRVVVIGGGMTAIDAAVQSKLLGAEEVTICYRRGKEHMNASEFEQDLAHRQGRHHPPLAAAEARHRPRAARSPASSSNTPRCATAGSSAPARPSRSPPTRCSRRSARPSCRLR